MGVEVTGHHLAPVLHLNGGGKGLSTGGRAYVQHPHSRRRAGGQHRQPGSRVLDVEQTPLKGLQLLHAAATGEDQAILQPGVGLYLYTLGLQRGGSLRRPRPDSVHHGGHGGLAVVGPEERRRPL